MFFKFIIGQRVGKKRIAKLLSHIAFWQGESIFYLKISKYLNGYKGGPYSRPVVDKLSTKLTETYILAFVKDVSTYIQTFIVKG